MSLIVLSNQSSEEDIVGTDDSIYKPYNFRNAISSTVKIPKNAQIALQSAKINLDGSIIIGNDSKLFYLYIGQGIRGSLGDNFNRLDSIEESTGFPIQCRLYDQDESENIKVNPYELGRELEKTLNRFVYNPQYTNTITVSQLIANDIFSGYTINFPGQISANDGRNPPKLNNALPSTDMAVDGSYQSVRDGRVPAGWTYGNPPGVGSGTVTVALNQNRTQHVTFNCPPIAHKRGVVKYDVTGAYEVAGAANTQCNFAVGLSRSVNTQQALGVVGGANQLNPPYYVYYNGTGYLPWVKGYLDFGVCVNDRVRRGYAAGELMLVQSVVNSRDINGPIATRNLINLPKLQNLDYTQCPQSHFHNAARFNVWNDNLDDGTPLHSIEFRVSGEALSVFLLSAGQAGDGSDGTYYTLIEYDATQQAEHNLKPISQDCWSLYPHVMIQNRNTVPASANKRIVIEEYTGIYGNFVELNTGIGNDWVTYDSISETMDLVQHNGIPAGGWRIPGDKGGYYSWEAELIIRGESGPILDIMNRAFIDRGSTIYTALAPNPVAYDDLTSIGGDLTKTVWRYNKPVLILQESNRYYPSQNANFKRLLGFENTPVVDFFQFGEGQQDADYIVSSTSTPRLVSSKSIFVRIHNFTQESVNAFQGNVSKIIAHLPRFDGTNVSGPLYLEPNNMVYMDLNNSEELNISSFDISLCYVDESYADSLVGTTIIVLHVKQKDDTSVGALDNVIAG